MFYCLAACGLYSGLGSPPGVAAFVEVLASMLFPSVVGLWLLADARQRHRSLPYDFGSFVFFAWMLVVPIYLFSTRGWRAFVTLGYFALLYLAAALVGNIPSLLVIFANERLAC
jgi:hypothetical protein